MRPPSQDARIHLAMIMSGQRIVHELSPMRHAWLQVLRGAVKLNGTELETSDGAAISDESRIEIVGTTNAELMLFDLA